MEIFPGAFHYPSYLTVEEQRALVQRCVLLGDRPAGFYAPTVRGGGKMSIQMVCLGLHWNPKTYRYEQTRSDYDGLPAQELPEDFSELARRIAREAGMEIEPDICILNFYHGKARLGLHQDKDEKPETIQAGIPVVSISLGDTAQFLVGGLRRRDSVQRIMLRSGDAFLLGGSSRLRYHGVTGVIPGTAPEGIGLQGRFNLTFRQYQN